MRILLTNDDGIEAPGIVALNHALQGLGEIIPIAPKTVQSATSHGITFSQPLMTEEINVDKNMHGIAVDGRPADCVKVGIRAIWEERFGEGTRPDLTISGMNAGANVGINVIYSGTVAAAVESAFLGIPSIAVSLYINDRGTTCFARAAEIARIAIDRVLEHKIDPHCVININIPVTESEDAPVPEIRVVGMNSAAGTDAYDRRVTPWNQVYYWPSGDGMAFYHTTPESDVEAIEKGFITITPLTYVMTDHARLQTWKERLGD